MFDPSLPSHETTRGPLSLRQGDRSVSGHIIDFNILVTESQWNKEALMEILQTGLNNKIMDELANSDFPLSLKQLEDLATRIDLCIIEWKKKNVLLDL